MEVGGHEKSGAEGNRGGGEGRDLKGEDIKEKKANASEKGFPSRLKRQLISTFVVNKMKRLARGVQWHR